MDLDHFDDPQTFQFTCDTNSQLYCETPFQNSTFQSYFFSSEKFLKGKKHSEKCMADNLPLKHEEFRVVEDDTLIDELVEKLGNTSIIHSVVEEPLEEQILREKSAANRQSTGSSSLPFSPIKPSHLSTPVKSPIKSSPFSTISPMRSPVLKGSGKISAPSSSSSTSFCPTTLLSPLRKSVVLSEAVPELSSHKLEENYQNILSPIPPEKNFDNLGKNRTKDHSTFASLAPPRSPSKLMAPSTPKISSLQSMRDVFGEVQLSSPLSPKYKIDVLEEQDSQLCRRLYLKEDTRNGFSAQIKRLSSTDHYSQSPIKGNIPFKSNPDLLKPKLPSIDIPPSKIPKMIPRDPRRSQLDIPSTTASSKHDYLNVHSLRTAKNYCIDASISRIPVLPKKDASSGMATFIKETAAVLTTTNTGSVFRPKAIGQHRSASVMARANASSRTKEDPLAKSFAIKNLRFT